MSIASDKFKNIREQLDQGLVPESETVKSFLGWFGFERRGWRVAETVRTILQEYKLRTEPDFEDAYIHASIQFDDEVTAGALPPDPSHKIGRLVAANKQPVCVKPDDDLASILTAMLANNFSQVPLVTTPTVVKGVVSWKSLGSRLALGKNCATAKDCMEPAVIVGIEEPLFSVISLVTRNDFVLVQGADKQIKGIVTASDLNDQFILLAEPFLLLGEIENTLRRMLHGKFNKEALIAAKHVPNDDRKINGVSDLTFGEYVKLMENIVNWQKLSVRVDRVEFINRLNRINGIRNDVMHFDPDGIEDSELEELRVFAKFLKTLRDIGVA